MKLLDTVSLSIMVGVLVALLHASGTISLSPAPLVQALLPESAIVQAERHEREQERERERAAPPAEQPSPAAVADGR